jgi:hypothetical protein
MIWNRPGGIVAQAGFKPTVPRASLTQDRGATLRRVPIGLASRRSAVADVRDREHSLSLSPLTIKRKTPAEASIFPSLSPQCRGGYRHLLVAGQPLFGSAIQ